MDTVTKEERNFHKNTNDNDVIRKIPEIADLFKKFDINSYVEIALI